MGEGLRETGGREEDKEAAIVFRGGGEIEPASAMLGPRLAGEGGSKAMTSWPGVWMGWEAKS